MATERRRYKCDVCGGYYVRADGYVKAKLTSVTFCIPCCERMGFDQKVLGRNFLIVKPTR